MAFGAPTLECGKYADAPAICNDQIKFFNYEGKGKLDRRQRLARTAVVITAPGPSRRRPRPAVRSATRRTPRGTRG